MSLYSVILRVVHLLSFKSMPVLLYCLEACSITASNVRAFEHPVTTAFMKIFRTNSSDVAYECWHFRFRTVRERV